MKMNNLKSFNEANLLFINQLLLIFVFGYNYNTVSTYD